eukprot:CAMPEP_0170555956 /NCGR_PEP_ID=MMETSP0211-20121228/14849_1 /TAXON_ID=311385 /ORGANISM="Pseudokeronopsis sp., Strain OXSARD2" /LENGTH=316 /DNA_ID=CAMNT_0010866003 /DNA_START=20 /DNA_END=970 /DNA_ORIENTATION=-
MNLAHLSEEAEVQVSGCFSSNIRHVSVKAIGLEVVVTSVEHSCVDREGVEGVRLQNDILQKSGQADVLRPNVLYVLMGIHASLLANSSEVVIIGLNNVPVVVIESGSVGNSISVLADDYAFVGAWTGQYHIEGHDSFHGAESFHSSCEIFNLFEGFSERHTDILHSNVNFSQELEGVDDALLNASGVHGERPGVSSVGTSDTLVSTKHDSIIEVLFASVELGDVSSVPAGVREGEVHVPSVDNGAVSLSGHDGGAQNIAQLEGVVQHEDHPSFLPNDFGNTIDFSVVLKVSDLDNIHVAFEEVSKESGNQVHIVIN